MESTKFDITSILLLQLTVFYFKQIPGGSKDRKKRNFSVVYSLDLFLFFKYHLNIFALGHDNHPTLTICTIPHIARITSTIK